MGRLLAGFGKALLGSLVMGLFGFFVCRPWIAGFMKRRETFLSLGSLLLSIIAGGLVYYVSVCFLKSDEALSVQKAFKKVKGLLTRSP